MFQREVGDFCQVLRIEFHVRSSHADCPAGARGASSRQVETHPDAPSPMRCYWPAVLGMAVGTLPARGGRHIVAATATSNLSFCESVLRHHLAARPCSEMKYACMETRRSG
jgi:hypothetical protein